VSMVLSMSILALVDDGAGKSVDPDPIIPTVGSVDGVFYLQPYLVVSRVGVEERKALASCRRIDDLVDSRQREVIFRAMFLQCREVDTHPVDLGVLLFHHDRWRKPCGLLDLSDELGLEEAVDFFAR
jgi:hypothetical protein